MPSQHKVFQNRSIYKSLKCRFQILTLNPSDVATQVPPAWHVIRMQSGVPVKSSSVVVVVVGPVATWVVVVDNVVVVLDVNTVGVVELSKFVSFVVAVGFKAVVVVVFSPTLGSGIFVVVEVKRSSEMVCSVLSVNMYVVLMVSTPTDIDSVVVPDQLEPLYSLVVGVDAVLVVVVVGGLDELSG